MADLFDVVVARKLSGGGGGGSSDFSTATVTVVNTTEHYETIEVQGAFYVEANELGEGSPSMTYTFLETDEPETIIKNVALYKGNGYVGVTCENVPVTVSVSGDATLMGSAAIITGDCTITIS